MVKKTCSIDDVPMLGLTLWSEKYNGIKRTSSDDRRIVSEIKN